MNDVIEQAAQIIQRANIEKAEELQEVKATYRALLLADDPQAGDAESLVKAMAVLGLDIGDPTADARAIAARQKVVAEIAEKEEEAARVAVEADALKPVIAGILQNNRDASRSDETVQRQRQLYTTAEGHGHDARQLRVKLRMIEQTAPRIYGKW